MSRRAVAVDVRDGVGIGPCRDPLALWFVEWVDQGQTWRRYFMTRQEARQARAAFLAGGRRWCLGDPLSVEGAPHD